MTTTHPGTEYYPLNFDTYEGVPWESIQLPGIVPGYQLSIYGEVKSPKGRILKSSSGGVQQWISLRRTNGKQRSIRLDKLMLTTFKGEPEPGQVPRHLNADTDDNAISNLIWADEEHPDAVKNAHARRGKEAQAKRAAPKTRTPQAPRPTKPKPTPPRMRVTHTYALEDVQVVVGEDSAIVQIIPDPNQGLTPHQTVLLCQLMAGVAEMNVVMGVT